MLYEHCTTVVPLDGVKICQALDALAREGWELINSFPTIAAASHLATRGQPALFCLLRRKKLDLEELVQEVGPHGRSVFTP